MKISEMIQALQAILETEGDLRVTVYDEYLASEGWGYEEEDLWVDARPEVEVVVDDGKEVEKVVRM